MGLLIDKVAKTVEVFNAYEVEVYGKPGDIAQFLCYFIILHHFDITSEIITSNRKSLANFIF